MCRWRSERINLNKTKEKRKHHAAKCIFQRSERTIGKCGFCNVVPPGTTSQNLCCATFHKVIHSLEKPSPQQTTQIIKKVKIKIKNDNLKFKIVIFINESTFRSFLSSPIFLFDKVLLSPNNSSRAIYKISIHFYLFIFHFNFYTLI